MGFEKVGSVWTVDSLSRYLSAIQKPDWCKAVTLHHTATPSLSQRPQGLLIRHVENMRDFYKNVKGWNSGPHLFIEDDQIFGMCDLRKKGIHAVSFNSFAIGIEVLGCYDSEDPRSGRGLACWQTAAGAVRVLLGWLELPLDENTVLFHRDDPKTKKTCPGAKVAKSWLLPLIGSPAGPPVTETAKPDVGIAWSEWAFRGERWCVPAYRFLTAKGVPSDIVIKQLKTKGGKIYYGEELLEGAHYVGKESPLIPNNCTWAPAHELMDLL